MASVLVFIISVISLFLAPVTSQMDIVSVKTIEDGTPFKITCNAQRVIATQGNFSVISSLQIFVLSNGANVLNNGVQDYRMVAQYQTLPLGGFSEVLQDPPAGRKWQFSFNGSNSENRGTNNKATMKIEILVPDTTCADAGLYKCAMAYYINNGALMNDNNIQNVTSRAKTTEPLIVLDPIYDAPTGITNTSAYDLGANITVSCSFMGPEELGMKWKREVRPAMGVDVRYEDYPVMNDITTDAVTRQPGTSAVCPEYAHKSVLRLTISEDDDQRLYQCVVMSNNVETTSSAAKIEINNPGQGTVPPGSVAAASGKPDNLGLIIGLAVGIPLAIIIVVVIIVVVCRRRSKGSNKNKHEADRPDGGHEPYVPPPVLYSRPNKGVNNNNNNNNRDSKALDDVGRRELHNKHDDGSYRGKEGKPHKYNPSYGNDAYTHEHNQTYGVSQHNQDDLHYASTDVSRSDDESVVQPVVPPGRNTSKPKPRNPPPVPRKREEGKSLNYIQLDLPPGKTEGSKNAGNRNRATSVEYAEISV